MKNSPKFFALVKEAITTYEAKWVHFTTLALLTVGTGTYLQFLVSKVVRYFFAKEAMSAEGFLRAIRISFVTLIQSEIIAGIIGGILASLLGLILVAGAVKLLQEEKAGLKEALKFGFKNLWKMILTALYVFWYTLSWALFLVLGFLAVSFMAKFSKFGLTAVLNTEIESEPMQEAVSGTVAQMMEGASGMVNFALIVLGIILLVVTIYRSVKATFAYFALLSEKNTGVFESVKKSAKAVKGNFWTVLLFLLTIGVFASLIMSIITTAVAKVAAESTFSGHAEIAVSVILTAVFVPIMISFEYLLYKKLKKS
jgi:hypothetical protein